MKSSKFLLCENPIATASNRRKSNNPDGRPLVNGPTEMVSRRIPINLMNEVRKKSQNTTAFIILAIKEKLEKAH